MLLSLLVLVDAHADPFNVWPERTPRGTIGLNPYLTAAPTFASAYAFVGAADGLDLILGASGGFEEGAAFFGPYEVFVRAFPFPDADVALVAHASYTSPDDWFIGPEVHVATRPLDWFGFWLDLGYRGRDRVDPGYLWTGIEFAASRPFVAFEVDFELADDGSVGTTFVPSVGVWLGRDYATGISVGAFISPDPGVPFGMGAWVWRSFDLRRREPLGPYHVGEDCRDGT